MLGKCWATAFCLEHEFLWKTLESPKDAWDFHVSFAGCLGSVQPWDKLCVPPPKHIFVLTPVSQSVAVYGESLCRL